MQLIEQWKRTLDVVGNVTYQVWKDSRHVGTQATNYHALGFLVESVSEMEVSPLPLVWMLINLSRFS